MITGLYLSIFGLVLIFLIVRVVLLRMRYKVSLGDGGHDDLLRAMRVHGNYVETIPMALLVMLMVELGGASLWVVHAMGVTMIVSRVLHFIGLTHKGYDIYRVIGMILMMSVYILGAAFLITVAFYEGPIPLVRPFL